MRTDIPFPTKPKVELSPLEGTAITPRSQQEWDLLMRVMELSGYQWKTGHSPTKLDYFRVYKQEGVAVSAGRVGDIGPCKKGIVIEADELTRVKGIGCRLMSVQEYLRFEGIDEKLQREIREYYAI